MKKWARCCVAAAVLALSMTAFAADNPISLDTNETLFAVLTAMNTCGYDQNLLISDPMRRTIRAGVERNLSASSDAQESANELCDFYLAHRANDDAHDLSQYISLALYIQGPPHFLPKVREELMPPDAAWLTGFSKLLERFYDKAGLHNIWEHSRANYAAMAGLYHAPLAKMVFDTEVYLKLASAGYLGRTFTIYLDFMGDPEQVNARNYGADYYVIVFPPPDSTSEATLKMEQIRHTYLHYLMDPMAEKHYSAIKRLEPLLQSVKGAPLDESFKSDISLLVTECLIRAIEIRTTGDRHTPEAMRSQAVDDAVRQGYILTHFFYNALGLFEKDPEGMRTAYSEMLDKIDVHAEQKNAMQVQFASRTTHEVLQTTRMEDRLVLVTAEKRLAAGDAKGAQDLAQQALNRKIGDQGRALFILAEVAVANRDMAAARENFQKAIQAGGDAKVIGWSHVYLGRILDLKEDREAALGEYREALNTGAALPEIKAAAERGIAQPYEPPTKPQ